MTHGSTACRRLLPPAAAVAAVILVPLLVACGGPGRHIDAAAQARAASAGATPPAAEDFPAPETVTWKQGAFPSREALRQVRPGMGKDHVRGLLGWPHFPAGMVGVREWNYLFHFHADPDPGYRTCQYMVRFNDEMLTTGAYWRSPECETLAMRPAAIRPAVRPIAATSLAPAQAGPQKITLSADALFHADGASQADLRPEGRGQVELLAREILRQFPRIASIVVTGHTDHFDTGAAGDALSRGRADTVRDLLVQQGIDAAAVHASGAGTGQPVVECPGPKSAQRTECLRPNRRIEIVVRGAP